MPLQEHFHANGYSTARIGKVYHSRFEDEFRWDRVVDTYDAAPRGRRLGSAFGPSSRRDDDEPDGRAARRAAELLREKRRPAPLRRGGLPEAPRSLVGPRGLLQDVPAPGIALPAGKTRGRPALFEPRRGVSLDLPRDKWRDAIAAYYASVDVHGRAARGDPRRDRRGPAAGTTPSWWSLGRQRRARGRARPLRQDDAVRGVGPGAPRHRRPRARRGRGRPPGASPSSSTSIPTLVELRAAARGRGPGRDEPRAPAPGPGPRGAGGRLDDAQGGSRPGRASSREASARAGAIPNGLATGFIVGLMNGIFVAYIGLNAFVCTLATMSIIFGLCLTVTKGIMLFGLPQSFEFFGRGDVLGVPFRFIFMFFLLVVLWFFHSYTPTGRRMEAIGGNPVSARLSGIKVEYNRLLGYLLSGICAAAAGVLLASSTMSATSTQGSAYLLDAFGASFIGASTVRVGQFHIPGTFVGVLIVVIAVNGLVILMVPGYLTDMIKGIILLLAIMLSGVVGKFLQTGRCRRGREVGKAKVDP